MLVGNYKGVKVSDARSLVNNDLINQELAVQYYEPNGNAVSRSGDVCVVRFCDRWFINYADP